MWDDVKEWLYVMFWLLVIVGIVLLAGYWAVPLLQLIRQELS